MTTKKLLELANRYIIFLSESGYRGPKQIFDYSGFYDQETNICHCWWMCGEIQKTVIGLKWYEKVWMFFGFRNRKIEKMMRWLGFIQGNIYVYGLKDILQLREDSR